MFLQTMASPSKPEAQPVIASITASSEAAPKPFNSKRPFSALLFLDSRQERLRKGLARLDDKSDALERSQMTDDASNGLGALISYSASSWASAWFTLSRVRGWTPARP